jgi:hypothetical protein
MKRRVALLGSLMCLLAIFLGFLSLPVQQAFAVTPTFRIAADAKSDACAGIGLTGASCSGAGAQTQATTLLATIVNLVCVVVGIVAVVMIIIAGMKYITSGGDSSKVAGAKSSLLYAIIGLAVVAVAQTFVHYILNNV